MSRKFTGIHMFAILVGFFGTVMAVNFTMASLATSTFGGVTVKNSYVASQKFNSWLDQAAEQDALGWEVTTSWRDDGHLVVSATGPGTKARLAAHARHPLGREWNTVKVTGALNAPEVCTNGGIIDPARLSKAAKRGKTAKRGKQSRGSSNSRKCQFLEIKQ